MNHNERHPDESRVVIVTGGGNGVGAATSRWFAARGWRVLVNYSRSLEAAGATARDCVSLGGEAFAAQGDVSVDGDCRRLAEEAFARWGRIDALVNNAGTTKFVAARDLEGLTAEDFQQIYAVNAIGAFQMARACAARMSESGAIVNVSSMSTQSGGGSSIAYVASKGALNGLTVALARALAPRIRVNAVMPGFIEGDWLREGLGEAVYDRARGAYIERTSLATACSAAQIAETIGTLVTAAPLTTGQMILADAGYFIGRAPG
jgi:3-oxoacyl-[acyl-carrier protein] reductase